jgi:hypothetical protein
LKYSQVTQAICEDTLRNLISLTIGEHHSHLARAVDDMIASGDQTAAVYDEAGAASPFGLDLDDRELHSFDQPGKWLCVGWYGPVGGDFAGFRRVGPGWRFG